MTECNCFVSEVGYWFIGWVVDEDDHSDGARKKKERDESPCRERRTTDRRAAQNTYVSTCLLIVHTYVGSFGHFCISVVQCTMLGVRVVGT